MEEFNKEADGFNKKVKEVSKNAPEFNEETEFNRAQEFSDSDKKKSRKKVSSNSLKYITAAVAVAVTVTSVPLTKDLKSDYTETFVEEKAFKEYEAESPKAEDTKPEETKAEKPKTAAPKPETPKVKAPKAEDTKAETFEESPSDAFEFSQNFDVSEKNVHFKFGFKNRFFIKKIIIYTDGGAKEILFDKSDADEIDIPLETDDKDAVIEIEYGDETHTFKYEIPVKHKKGEDENEENKNSSFNNNDRDFNIFVQPSDDPVYPE